MRAKQKSKPMSQAVLHQFLFYTRLILYLVTVLIPFFHPAVIVSYDLLGIGQWLVIVPLMMFAAFYLAPPILKPPHWLLISLGVLAFFSLIFAGFSVDFFFLFLGGFISFSLTVLVFHTQGKGRVIASLELLFIGFIYLSFLYFSRSSKEIAQASLAISKILLILSILSFFLHAFVLFLASFPTVLTGLGKRRLVYFFIVILSLGLALSFLLPIDFVLHKVTFNPLEEQLEPKTRQLDSNSPFEETRNQRDRNGRLEGLELGRWDAERFSRRRGRGGKQYSVMIVATPAQSLYLGNDYLGKLDEKAGLTLSQTESLNELADMRLLETWRNTDQIFSKGRTEIQATFFSTLVERYLAYQVREITPTILKQGNYPFLYSFSASFGLSLANEEDLALAGDLTTSEKKELAEYLEIPFKEETNTLLRQYLHGLIGGKKTKFEKLKAVLENYREYQYELGYSDEASTERILNFLFNTKTGDCTEFANATAILARYLGFPSRVVQGYLADRSLQLPKHLAGLSYLQKNIEDLAQYQLEELILVTTAHRHAWVQLYFPEYGWIDIEATSYAKPPRLGGDANDWSLIVPLMEKQKEEEKTAKPFPWEIVLYSVLFSFGGLLVLLYLLRFAKELLLFIFSRSLSLRGLKALQRLLLIRLVNRGYPLKKPHQTLKEYAKVFPELSKFEKPYTELRYRLEFEPGEKEKIWQEVGQAYYEIIATAKPRWGKAKSFFYKVFSLKGLLC